MTTARLSFYEYGQRAVANVLAQIRGEQVPEIGIVPARLVVRQSCGCDDPDVVQAAIGATPTTGVRLEDFLTEKRAQTLVDLAQALGASPGAPVFALAEHLLDGLLEEFQGASPQRFLLVLADVLFQIASAGGDVAVWQAAIPVLRRYLSPVVGHDPLRSHFEDLWNQAQVLIGKTAHQQQGVLQLRTEQ